MLHANPARCRGFVEFYLPCSLWAAQLQLLATLISNGLESVRHAGTWTARPGFIGGESYWPELFSVPLCPYLTVLSAPASPPRLSCSLSLDPLSDFPPKTYPANILFASCHFKVTCALPTFISMAQPSILPSLTVLWRGRYLIYALMKMVAER